MAGPALASAAGDVATVGVTGRSIVSRRIRNTPATIARTTRARNRIPSRLWKNLLCGSARLLGRFIGSPLGQRVRGRDEIGLDRVVEFALVGSLQLQLRDVHQTGEIRDLAQECSGMVEAPCDGDLDRILGEVRRGLRLAGLEQQEVDARLLPRDCDLAQETRDLFLGRQELLRYLPALIQEL